MAIRDYSTIHNMKKFVMDQLAPKYFNMDKTNDLNVGALGFMTDLVGTSTEDAFNTVSVYLNEMFPHLAIMPETIYNNATLFKIDGYFGTASESTMYLFIPEDIVINNGTKSGDIYEFILDSDMLIDVEDLHFMLDYSIRIKYKIPSYTTEYVFTAEYMREEYGTVFDNTISNVQSPYLKIKRVFYENMHYLQIEAKVHQVDKFVNADNVITSDTINLPIYNIQFDNYLANFEVFYKPADSTKYTQLEKRLNGTTPVKNPFCYYKIVDENKLEISFSSRDNYFYPEYNSEIIINYYTTMGPEGNFDSYVGSDIVVTPSSQVYDYNNQLPVFAIPMGGSYNGAAPMSVDELKRLTVEMFSTVGSYTNENDLQLYFDRFNNKFNSDILFIKTRDDIFERMFSSFTIFKDSTDEIFHTNTLNIELTATDFDEEIDQSDISIIKPGHIFTYKDDSLDTVLMSTADLTNYNTLNDQFIYSNPFLIYFMKNPTSIAYYLTTVNNDYVVDYMEADRNSLVQFVCNQMNVKRNSLIGENSYHVKIMFTPTSELDKPMVIRTIIDNETGEYTDDITNSIRVKLAFNGDNGIDTCYYWMQLEEYDLELNTYTFGCNIETDDYISDKGKFRIVNAYDVHSNTIGGTHMVSMNNTLLNIYTYYNEDVYNTIPTFTNKYSTKSNPVTFIEPVEMMNSTVVFKSNNDGVIDETGKETGNTYTTTIKSVPLLKASIVADEELSSKFVSTMRIQYGYLLNIIDKITNNFSIDLKFYNTYGRSKNFYVDDYVTVNRLDKVNISIHFKIHPVFGTDEIEFIENIKLFIKEYIEGINNAGTNSIYISNLIKALENNFSSIEYLKFCGINEYPTEVQAIENTTVDLDTLTKEERINYVPEYLTLSKDDIIIDII